MNRNVLVTLLLFLPLMSIGCAATQVKQAWVDETYQGGKPEKVLIIAMISTPTVQREIESQFAKRFRDRGITATEGFRILSVDQLSAHDARDVVVAKVREMMVDAVLIVRRAASRTTKEYIPGMTIEHGMGGGTAAVVWSSAPTAPSTQAYSHETEFLNMEAQLYDARTERLIWFLQTETRLTGPPQEGIEPYVSLVSKKLFSAKPFH